MRKRNNIVFLYFIARLYFLAMPFNSLINLIFLIYESNILNHKNKKLLGIRILVLNTKLKYHLDKMAVYRRYLGMDIKSKK